MNVTPVAVITRAAGVVVGPTPGGGAVRVRRAAGGAAVGDVAAVIRA
jgi:hypothetical protein